MQRPALSPAPLHPPRRKRRAGMTLAELVMASTLGTLILTQVLSIALSCQRILAGIVENTELTITHRNLREKLLFRLTPDQDYGLAGSPIDALTNNRVTFHDATTPASLEHLSFTGTGGLLYSEALADDDGTQRWLTPRALRLEPAEEHAFQWNADLDTLYVNLSLATRDGRHKQLQTIAIPRFGKVMK